MQGLVFVAHTLYIHILVDNLQYFTYKILELLDLTNQQADLEIRL
jgi:hypothetical protein